MILNEKVPTMFNVAWQRMMIESSSVSLLLMVCFVGSFHHCEACVEQEHTNVTSPRKPLELASDHFKRLQ